MGIFDPWIKRMEEVQLQLVACRAENERLANQLKEKRNRVPEDGDSESVKAAKHRIAKALEARELASILFAREIEDAHRDLADAKRAENEFNLEP